MSKEFLFSLTFNLKIVKFNEALHNRLGLRLSKFHSRLNEVLFVTRLNAPDENLMKVCFNLLRVLEDIRELKQRRF